MPTQNILLLNILSHIFNSMESIHVLKIHLEIYLSSK